MFQFSPLALLHELYRHYKCILINSFFMGVNPRRKTASFSQTRLERSRCSAH